MLTSEFTTPLSGNPYYVSKGIIKATDKMGRKFVMAEIRYEKFDDQNFQYVFKPYYELIDFIPSSVFKDIPGINLDLKKDEYYRVNMIPSFISRRTPSESREDIKELLSSVGLDYYDRFEWLLRSKVRCGDDNLVVLRKTGGKKYTAENIDFDFISPDDTVTIQSLSSISVSSVKIIENAFLLLQSGAKIFIQEENRSLGDEERKTMLHLLKNMLENYDRNVKLKRLQNIDDAKKCGKYPGRKQISVDIVLLKEIKNQFNNKLITEKEAMEKLSLSSRATFYRKLKSVDVL